MFPEAEEDINSTFTSIPAQISIPMSFLREQMGRNRKTSTFEIHDIHTVQLLFMFFCFFQAPYGKNDY